MLLRSFVTLLLSVVLGLMPFSAMSATKIKKKVEGREVVQQNKITSKPKINGDKKASKSAKSNVQTKKLGVKKTIKSVKKSNADNKISVKETTKLASKTKVVEVNRSTKKSKKIVAKQATKSVSKIKVVEINNTATSLKKNSKKVKKIEKSLEQTASIHHGIKGARLSPTKIMDKKYSYRIKGKTHTTIGKEASRTYSQVGVASYYGGFFHGRKTANGEIFNKNAYTAAHKTLALGSYALVTNLRNGRKVIVRINDRGPFSHNRIIDLSVASAKAIGMLQSGVARVKVEAIIVDNKGNISGKGAESLRKIARK